MATDMKTNHHPLKFLHVLFPEHKMITFIVCFQLIPGGDGPEG